MLKLGSPDLADRAGGVLVSWVTLVMVAFVYVKFVYDSPWPKA